MRFAYCALQCSTVIPAQAGIHCKNITNQLISILYAYGLNQIRPNLCINIKKWIPTCAGMMDVTFFTHQHF